MRITEAAQRVGVSATTLKRLERRGLIRVRQDRNGQRRYTDRDIQEIQAFYYPQRRPLPPWLQPRPTALHDATTTSGAGTCGRGMAGGAAGHQQHLLGVCLLHAGRGWQRVVVPMGARFWGERRPLGFGSRGPGLAVLVHFQEHRLEEFANLTCIALVTNQPQMPGQEGQHFAFIGELHFQNLGARRVGADLERRDGLFHGDGPVLDGQERAIVCPCPRLCAWCAWDLRGSGRQERRSRGRR